MGGRWTVDEMGLKAVRSCSGGTIVAREEVGDWWERTEVEMA